MERRALGGSGLTIAPLIFGGNVFGWTADRATSFDLLDRFVDAGFDAIDTADVYSVWADGNEGGESETILGEWIAERGRRDDITLMSKVAKWPQRPGLSADNIAAAAEDSLRRLKTDRLDVYFAHEDDGDTPLEESLTAFDRLVRDGKVRALGASNYGADRLAEAIDTSEANGLARYEVLQPEYNLYARSGYEGPLRRTATDRGLGVTPYFALGAGFLTGKYRSKADIDGSAREMFLGDYFDDRGQRVLDALHEVAEDKGAHPAQVALAWLIRRDGVTAPIASARSVSQLDQTLGAATLRLDEAAMTHLTEAGAV